VANSDIAITELLLQHGANPNNLTDNAWNRKGHGETALYRAVCDSNMKIVLLLIEHGAEIDAKSWSCETALYRGVAGDADNIVRLLLNSGADINSRTGTGDTPLRRAMRAGFKSVKCIMEDFAKSSGIDMIAITTDASSQSSFLKKEVKEQQFSKINRSELLDMEEFMQVLEMDDEDDGPNWDLFCAMMSRSFFAIALEVNRVRDDMQVMISNFMTLFP